MTTGGTDTSPDYEYTDWDAVERVATELADYAASRRESTSAVSRLTPDLDRRGVVGLALLGAALTRVAYWLVARPRSDRREAAELPVRRSTASPAATTPE